MCLCTHAMMASGRTLWRVAEHLASEGVEAFVLDFRGHGDSVPPRAESDRGWCFDDYVELDLPAAAATAAGEAGIAPDELCHVGHCLGGLAALAAVGTGTLPQPRRLSLWATSVWLPGPRGSRLRRALMRAFLLSCLPLGYSPIRALRLGSDNEPRSYVEQMVGWATGARWTSRTGVDYMALLARVRAPVWAVTGDRDRTCSAADARVLLERLPGARPLRRVGVAQGDSVDADHFGMLARRELAPLWSELAQFLAES